MRGYCSGSVRIKTPTAQQKKTKMYFLNSLVEFDSNIGWAN